MPLSLYLTPCLVLLTNCFLRFSMVRLYLVFLVLLLLGLADCTRLGLCLTTFFEARDDLTTVCLLCNLSDSLADSIEGLKLTAFTGLPAAAAA